MMTDSSYELNYCKGIAMWMTVVSVSLMIFALICMWSAIEVFFDMNKVDIDKKIKFKNKFLL